MSFELLKENLFMYSFNVSYNCSTWKRLLMKVAYPLMKKSLQLIHLECTHQYMENQLKQLECEESSLRLSHEGRLRNVKGKSTHLLLLCNGKFFLLLKFWHYSPRRFLGWYLLWAVSLSPHQLNTIWNAYSNQVVCVQSYRIV